MQHKQQMQHNAAQVTHAAQVAQVAHAAHVAQVAGVQVTVCTQTKGKCLTAAKFDETSRLQKQSNYLDLILHV